MTDREKAVVMAYTGTIMLDGDKLGIFYDYVAELMGTRLDTIAIAMLAENIKHRATPEFMQICKTVEEPRPHGRWIEIKNPFHRERQCSVCGNRDNPMTAIKGHYCWFCGAIMDAKEDEA